MLTQHQAACIEQFVADTEAELARALLRHGTFHSLHEAYAVLLEEVDELWDHVREKEHERKHAEVYKELVQISAVAAKAALYAKGMRDCNS